MGLVAYSHKEEDSCMDAPIASVNAVMAAFNSHMNKRPTLDINRYITDKENSMREE